MLLSIIQTMWPILAAVFGTSLAVGLLIVLTQRWHGHISHDTHIGIQKFHTQPTPRIGGVGVFLGVLSAFLIAPSRYYQGMFWTLVVAGIPAFAFGILEDITKRVSVRARLLATMLCGVLGWLITGYAITDVNIPGVDALLGITVVSVLFTAFAVSGIANALNIVDGFNGLAAGASIIMFGALGNISLQVGDTLLVSICLTMVASILGFWVLNWPLGRIFLGDGGAYFVGFSLAWVSVLLLGRNPQVSAWAPLLVCGYPVLEVVFSVYRRRRRNLDPGSPDRLHLHSLMNRRVVRKVFPTLSRMAHNSLTGAAMWTVALVPAVLAALWPTYTMMLVGALLACAWLYLWVYKRLTR